MTMRLLSKHNYTALLRTALLFGAIVVCQSLLLTACSSSDDVEPGPNQHPSEGDKVKVTFRIAPAGTKALTRAAGWMDTNVPSPTYDEEMMNVWTVVMVNDNGNKVERIFVGKPTKGPETANDNREIDFVVENLVLTSGDKYHIYSFANIAPTRVFSMLGMSVTNYTDPTADGVKTFDASVIKAANDAGTTGDTEATLIPKPATGGNDHYVDDIEVSLGANGKVYSDLTATDDPFGFGSKGIPMSNVQTFTVPSEDATKDLIVIRMFAKIEFRIFNQSESTDLRLKSITITDVTANPTTSESTLKLLPVLSNHDTMEATHADLKQDVENNMPTVTTADYKYELATPLTISKNTKYTDVLSTPAQTIAFYINESKAPTGGDNLFHIAVELMDADNLSTSESRFAVITKNDNAEGYTGDWDYIARNDYRIIPLVLDDVRYRLELIPYDFPEIGVYPSSAKLLNATKNLWQIDFHDYGHFHLVPRVVKIAASTTTEIPFSATKAALSGGKYADTTWSLIDENGTADAADWTASWKSWTDENKTTEYSASNAATVGLYGQRDGAGAAVYASLTDYAYPTAADASENGNFPVLDTNTKWNGYNATSPSTAPYIFGQIAPHTKDQTASCYHEFSVRVYPMDKPLPYELIYRVIVNYKQDHAAARKAVTRCCDHN